MTNLKKPPIKKSINSEFERVSVPEKNHKTWKSFLGMYAGEHAAGTEFMIGPLFLTVGVSAFDLIVGLFFGNLFAVLSWRYLTAKIAVKERFTLFIAIISICAISILVLDFLLPFFDKIINLLVDYSEITTSVLLLIILYKSFKKKYDLIFFVSIGLLTGFLMSFLYM